ncbi:baseplate wedge subunit and tail pin [Synechococcus phage S-H38]|uniref:Baseplate wedge subunit and tail pin n=1 Tax=Synechococcus phage S-H38 TaxID=2783673 RepID=A0A873WIY1_9CAUD|nr:baseplate wedge subunit and tail pin [Synechococcus phage S-H38]QPB07965.1 baseplate wedge subunit and tail pin [Synechococcus phage S-H38]
MARQTINVGSIANDGTGDTLRSGGQKINSMFLDAYSKLGDGSNILFDIDSASDEEFVLRSNGTAFVPARLSYNDLSDTPTIPASQQPSNWLATEGATQILNKPLLADVATSGSYGDLTGTPTIPAAQVSSDWTATTGVAQILNKPTLGAAATSNSYNDLDNLPSLFSGAYADLTGKPVLATVATSGSWNDLNDKPSIFSGSWNDLADKPSVPSDIQDLANVTITTPTSGQVLKWSGTAWVNDTDQSGGGSGSGLQSRGTFSATTSSLAAGASENLTIIGYKSYGLLNIEVNGAAWVTIYTDTGSRLSDATRAETDDPLPGSGVIAELITTGSSSQIMTPATIGFNNDITPSTNIYLKVVNKAATSAAITVTLTVIQLES